jgi:hypothetical protein
MFSSYQSSFHDDNIKILSTIWVLTEDKSPFISTTAYFSNMPVLLHEYIILFDKNFSTNFRFVPSEA